VRYGAARAHTATVAHGEPLRRHKTPGRRVPRREELPAVNIKQEQIRDLGPGPRDAALVVEVGLARRRATDPRLRPRNPPQRVGRTETQIRGWDRRGECRAESSTRIRTRARTQRQVRRDNGRCGVYRRRALGSGRWGGATLCRTPCRGFGGAACGAAGGRAGAVPDRGRPASRAARQEGDDGDWRAERTGGWGARRRRRRRQERE
jgi:hypothetical protein